MTELEAVGLEPVRLRSTGCYVDIGTGELSVALRADIDALPIQEATGLEFSSQNPGVAHMCGHDIHTTVMLGVATVLADLNRTSPLSGRVRVLFQPAEEQLPGGALTVIEQDVLEGSRGSSRCTASPRSTSARSAPASGRSPRPRTRCGCGCPERAVTPRART